MARHLMAVCVVCLLCADHLPCEQHVKEVPSTKKSTDIHLVEQDGKLFQTTHLPQTSSIISGRRRSRLDHDYPDLNIETINSRKRNNFEEEKHYHTLLQRRKRHASHIAFQADQSRKPDITENFISRIFAEYGHSDGSIHASGFKDMLRRLGLHKLVDKSLITSNESCIPFGSMLMHLRPHDHHHTNELCVGNGIENSSDCITKLNDDDYSLSENDIINLCPILLHQLVSPLQQDHVGCINSSLLMQVSNMEAVAFEKERQEMVYVWVYAFVSVMACGILGLVGVAIIPFMDSRYYKHIIQFLVSLAVGTMTGDALLHLLPHSLAGQSEANMIFKGLTCMGGIIFFYMTEHGLTMISEWRKRIVKNEKQASRAKVVRDTDSSMNNSVAGDKLCKSKYSSYPYCYDEIAMDTKNDVWLHLPNSQGDRNDNSNADKKKNGKEVGSCNDMNETGQSLLSQSNYTPISDTNHLPDSNTISTNLDDTSIVDVVTGVKDKTLVRNDTVTVILREHESSHHGHSHKHGHVHSPPESLSAVAWMIIMGDGLHNFTDGMAIGAAFAENIAGGFSTSLAVFCHELPHELGDFAILMKAGMSVKSAVYYNLLTGVLSFFGMIFGIVFGQSQNVAQWMFAAAAGLFIYIALVDMMPELSAAHKSIEQFILQILGMSTGIALMLLIAIYEEDLMSVFSTPRTEYNHVH